MVPAKIRASAGWPMAKEGVRGRHVAGIGTAGTPCFRMSRAAYVTLMLAIVVVIIIEGVVARTKCSYELYWKETTCLDPTLISRFRRMTMLPWYR